MPKRIHLDTDIGGDTDDLCALALLLGLPDVELTGITTCTGDTAMRAGLAAYVLKMAGRQDIPVAAGAAGSIAGFRMPPELPDLSRYWPEPIDPLPSPPGAALDLLAASIESGATVVAIGPFTNLALLETLRPGILATTEIVLMGGYLDPPRPGMPAWGPDMDYNVQADTAASRIVFERSDPILVPLTVCLDLPIRAADLPALRAAGPLGALIADQSALYGEHSGMTALGRAHPALPDDLLNFHYDPLACAVAAGWPGATIDRLLLRLDMEDGSLRLARANEGKPTRMTTQAQSEPFAKFWLDATRRTATNP
jgi:purine nucleosidase